MKVILCFGDSNTHGADPAGGSRFGPTIRWPGVLQATLGEDYRVIEEGLNGRTTNLDDIIEVHRNGSTYLMPCLESHRPIDLVTIMLGTNDLKRRFNRCASDIAQSAASLGVTVSQSQCGPDGGMPRVLLMAPPPLAKLTDYAEMFEGGLEKSLKFGHFYGFFAEKYGFDFLDVGQAIKTSELDGIHFEADAHRALGIAVADKIKGIVG
jgi:lysophospholipase L1-like esterase